MIVDLSKYNMESAQSLDHALDLLSREEETWTPLAGGTDLMVIMQSLNLSHGNYLNIMGVDELIGIETDEDQLLIKAATSFSNIKNHPVIVAEFPLLAQAANLIGARAIQNRGTIGGNIVNASPAADSLPPLLCYDADLELKSKKSTRWIPVSEFYSGHKQMEIRKTELLTGIRLKRVTASNSNSKDESKNKSKKFYEYYKKVGARKAQAISKVSFSGRALMDEGKSKINEIQIALGSVAPYALRVKEVEKVLIGQTLGPEVIKRATEALSNQITPIDDIRSNKLYRMRVSINLLQHFLEILQCTR